jgi:nicotinate phosphoribosyltransferase
VTTDITARTVPAISGTGLLTDHYELTMIRAALEGGTASRRTVFEMFARQLPTGRRYGVVAGTGRFLDALARFAFGSAELDFLLGTGVIDEPTAEYLAGYRFTGNIWGYPEGECYFPGSPILVVDGTFAEAVVLETIALSIFNHDCAVASAASRMVSAAGPRPIIEMGSRRTHEIAAVAAARAAYIAGFATTSNLRAGLDYGVPTAGTSAHAFIMVFDDERQAFCVQLEALGLDTTLLVDTYDVPTAVRTAVELAGSALGAVRIDSGDVAAVASGVRAQLDSLGASHTRIVVTGDLDEFAIAELASAPVDGYGVGTALVTGSGAPTAALVYKLVARSADNGPELVPVAKRSVGKPTMGGRKWAARAKDQAGIATAEVISLTRADHEPGLRPLLAHLVRDGEIIGAEPLGTARDRHRHALAELPAEARLPQPGEPAIPTRFPSADASVGALRQ